MRLRQICDTIILFKDVYHMSNFTIKRSLFLVPTLYMVKEFEKIDKFMIILEKSNVSDIINNKTILYYGRKYTKTFNNWLFY